MNNMNTQENLNYKTLPEMENKLSKIISLGQNKTSDLKTLKESNINKFKEVFEFQLNYINKIKQDELNEELENVINLLDEFFQRDFNERKKDLNEIENLKKEEIQIQEELAVFLGVNKKFIKNVKNTFKSKIKISLTQNKDKLKSQLESKDYNNILEEINNQIKTNLKGLNENILTFIQNNEKETNELISVRKKIINQFSLKDYKIINPFNIDICKKIGNGNDLEEQLSTELKSSCNSFNILWKKGIIEFFNSLFSDLSYLENIVDVLIDTSLKKISFILDLIEEESRIIINSNYKKISFLIKMACLEFTDEQKKIWEELCDLYKDTRTNLINIKSNIIEILNQKKK